VIGNTEIDQEALGGEKRLGELARAERTVSSASEFAKLDSRLGQEFLILPAWCPVHEAVRLALSRDRSVRLQPIVVELAESKWGVVDVAEVLHSQSEILTKQIAAHRETVKSLESAERKYRSIFENAIEGIFQTSSAGEYLAVNPALARMYGFESVADLMNGIKNIQRQLYVDPKRRDEFVQIMKEFGVVRSFESEIYRKDGSTIWISEHARAVRDEQGTLLYYEGAVEDISARKRAEFEREEMQKRLLNASRQAGMAEVATGVLHNVGNVLNSVMVSASMIGTRLRQSKVTNFGKAVGILAENKDRLGEFFTQDEKGKVLPGYFVKLAEMLAADHQLMIDEVSALARSIEHIREIVSSQQTFARVNAVETRFDMRELVDDAIRINQASFERHHIEIQKDYGVVPQVVSDKHHILQILINLISNAKKAVRDTDNTREKKVIVRMYEAMLEGRESVRIEVIDNGEGIPAENITKIFQHGFTTRTDGHGFGLHNSANAAKQLGGTLTAESEGPGKGARFILELPIAKLKAVAS
jgi:PAS domain S-box-containing protein